MTLTQNCACFDDPYPKLCLWDLVSKTKTKCMRVISAYMLAPIVTTVSFDRILRKEKKSSLKLNQITVLNSLMTALSNALAFQEL